MLSDLLFSIYAFAYRVINRHYFYFKHRQHYYYIAVQEAYEKGDIKRFGRELKNAISGGYGDFVGYACFGILMRSLDVDTKLAFTECIVEFSEDFKYSPNDAKIILRKMLWCLSLQMRTPSYHQRSRLIRKYLEKYKSVILERIYDGLFVLGELIKHEPGRSDELMPALNHLIVETCLLQPTHNTSSKPIIPTISTNHGYLCSLAAIQSIWNIYAEVLKQDAPHHHINTYGVFYISAKRIQRSWRRYRDRKLRQSIALIAHSKNLSPEIAQVIYAHTHIHIDDVSAS